MINHFHSFHPISNCLQTSQRTVYTAAAKIMVLQVLFQTDLNPLIGF